MRSPVRVILLVTGLILASSFFAHADLITLSISEQGSGTLGAQAFTNQLVTFSGSFTTQVLASCQADFTCFEGSGDFFIDNEADLPPADLGLTVIITVGRLGTLSSRILRPSQNRLPSRYSPSA